MSRGVFVVGTDTGVGKTFVAGGLAANLRYIHARQVGVFKPVETGVGPDGPADALFLRRMAGLPDLPIDAVCPYAYADPVAPVVAARAAGRPIDLDRLDDAFRALEERFGFVIVEGAGGLLVPYGEELMTVDLVRRFDLPVLVVARDALGTVNHTLLTLAALQAARQEVLGVILNRSAADLPGPHALDNARLIRDYSGGVQVLGTVPHFPPGQPDDPLWMGRVADGLEACVDLYPVLAAAAPR